MGYVESTLLPGETIVYRTRLHWTVLLGHLLIGVLFIALAIVAAVAAVAEIDLTRRPMLSLAAFVLVAFAVIVFIAGAVRRNATEIAVTNRRVLIKKGILKRETLELFISKIESVVVNESFPGRMLGYGTVVVRGTGGTPEVFDRVSHPIEFRRRIQSQIEVSPGQTGAARPG